MRIQWQTVAFAIALIVSLHEPSTLAYVRVYGWWVTVHEAARNAQGRAPPA